MRRLLATVVAISMGIAVLAPEAAGQCTITHRAMDGSYVLCTSGGTAWEWTGPNGFTASTICIMVSDPGTYTCRVFDGFSGTWGDPCEFTFTSVPVNPECSIAGADSICAGTSTSWCGPSGVYLYTWTGPNGFSASTACVDVSAAGDYSLLVTDATTGAAGDPCTRTLTLTSCAPQGGTGACPAPAHWWGRSCSGDAPPLDATTFAHVAAMVDERSAVWDFGGTADGFCALLHRGHGTGDAASAKRHYAAVLANLCAAQMGVTTAGGIGLGLEPTMPIVGVRGVPADWTVGDWVASTEARLTLLAGLTQRVRGSGDELRRIARQARAINRLAGTCSARPAAMAEDDDAELDFGTDLSAWSGAASTSGSPTQDPSSGPGRVRWTLTRSESVDLTIMDVTGRRLRHLASGVYSAGTHEWMWDGRDDDGRTMRSGAYFVAGHVGNQRLSQRLFILH